MERRQHHHHQQRRSIFDGTAPFPPESPLYFSTDSSLNPLDQRPVRPQASTQTLESAFSRLNVSDDTQPLYPSFYNGGLFDGSLVNFDTYSHGFATGGQRVSPMQDNNLMMSGHNNSDLRGCFLYAPYQNPILNEPALNRTTRFSSVSKNQNSVRATNRRPHWLQEPLNYLSLEDLRGKIVALAKDQSGCKILQRIVGSATKEQIDMLFLDVIDYVGELILDPFGNYVVQKLVEVCDVEQRTRILLMLTQNEFQLVSICLDMHGTRAVQKLVNFITTQQQISILVSALNPGAVALIKDPNGHHVIQHCVKYFSTEDNKYILKQVAQNCFEIATNKSGCCVLQRCVEFSQGEPRDRLVAEIIAHALLLAENHYGNYVVQHVLELRIQQITENLLTQFEGNYTSLSCNKYGSHVVERCLLTTREDQSSKIITELLSNPRASMLLADPFGNFVIQKALSVSKGQVQRALHALIQMNAQIMRSNIYGQKILVWMNKNWRLLHQ